MRSSMSKEHIEKFTQARLWNPGQYIQGIGANRDPLDATFFIQGFPDSSVGKESPCSAADPSSIPGLGRSSGEGKVYPLQYFGLENSTDCIVYGSQKIGRDWATFTFFIPEGRLSINVNSGFFGVSDGKESACDSGDLDSIPGLGRYPEEGNG